MRHYIAFSVFQKTVIITCGVFFLSKMSWPPRPPHRHSLWKSVINLNDFISKRLKHVLCRLWATDNFAASNVFVISDNSQLSFYCTSMERKFKNPLSWSDCRRSHNHVLFYVGSIPRFEGGVVFCGKSASSWFRFLVAKLTKVIAPIYFDDNARISLRLEVRAHSATSLLTPRLPKWLFVAEVTIQVDVCISNCIGLPIPRTCESSKKVTKQPTRTTYSCSALFRSFVWIQTTVVYLSVSWKKVRCFITWSLSWFDSALAEVVFREES